MATHEDLPVATARLDVVNKIKTNDVVLLVAETGSGKTTQIGSFLLDDVRLRRVCITQPRRVAAVTVAQRVAELRGCKLGEEVGYKVRFDDRTSPDKTRLVLITDGMLLRESMTDPLLSRYDCVVLDEAHERSLNTDILFGVVKRAMRERISSSRGGLLKVVVMSATMNVDVIRSFFLNDERKNADARRAEENAHPITLQEIRVKGRQYPVEIFYTREPLAEERPNAVVTTVLQIHEAERGKPGDILVFLSGREEIEAAAAGLRAEEEEHLTVCQLYASLSPEAQLAAFAPAPVGKRKVILATNVAETSVTVRGVRFVVDTGAVKSRTFDPAKRIQSLREEPTSRAQAEQRTGRAGREAPGKCYRLYPEHVFSTLEKEALPEIKRAPMDETVLTLLSLGVRDVTLFDFIEPPPARALKAALSELADLGAVVIKTDDLNATGPTLALTRFGRAMTRLPIEPVYAAMILYAKLAGVGDEICAMVAMMGSHIESPFLSSSMTSKSDSSEVSSANARRARMNAAKARLTSPTGDHVTGMRVLEEFAREFPEGRGKAWCRESGLRWAFLNDALNIRNQLRDVLVNLKTEECWGDAEGMHRKQRFEEEVLAREELTKEGETQIPRRALRCLAWVAGMRKEGIARNVKGTEYITDSGQRLYVHPTSALFFAGGDASPRFPESVVFDQVLVTSKPFMRGVSGIREEWAPRDAVASGPKRVHEDAKKSLGGSTPLQSKAGSHKARRMMIDLGVDE